MRSSKTFTFLIIMAITICSLASCGKEYDCETVSDISIIKKGDDPYKLTCLQIAEIMDKYAYVKGERVKRGSDKYARFLIESKSDSELHNIPEWPAVECYIDGYTAGGTIIMKDITFDDDKLPVEMTNKTIREYVFDQWGLEV